MVLCAGCETLATIGGTVGQQLAALLVQ